MKLVRVEVSHVEALRRVSVSEACRLCQVEVQFFEALVDEGVFTVQTQSGQVFLKGAEFARLRKASRLFHDLGVNPPGIALALELLAQLDSRRR
ncbi:MAG: chaperone modulatory protein CbpM [Candidatus Azotimanducaceae bacterium]|jgi:chaperone modulatory protein CbpM